MDLRNLASSPSLRLAWRRVASGLNTGYKSPYRPLLEAYELAADEALADLRMRLLGHAYEPTPPLRMYYPKSSGLQRPISYLVIEDLIVYQAFANLLSRKIRDRRTRLEGRLVFSNYFDPPRSPFAVGQWWVGFAAMQVKFESLFRAGFKWVVKFDLASFYDTISHDLLLRILAPRGGSGGGLTEYARAWLATWSSPMPTRTYSHGIPQGPVASDILAECLLLPVDESMASRFKYVRYVDDIRLFARSEEEIKRGIVHLDKLCRELGLIPHVDKLGVTRLARFRDVRALTPAIDTYHRPVANRELKEHTAWDELSKALDRRRRNILDKSRLRFTLFRAPRSARILRLILRIWLRFPEHTDAFIAALEPYQRPFRITAAASSIVRSRLPYDAVKGEAWKLLARLAPRRQLRSLSKRAIDVAKDPSSGPSTQIGALAFLCRCHAFGLGHYSAFLRWAKHPLVQAFVAPFLPVHDASSKGTARQLIRRTAPDPALALTVALQISRIDPRALLAPGEFLHTVPQVVFEAAALIPGTIHRRRDRIGILLARRYAIRDWLGWRRLLVAEYNHAHALLIQADTYFGKHHTPWLAQQDVFNEVVFRALQDRLSQFGAPGVIPTVRQNGDQIDYGSLIRVPRFRRAHPALAAALIDVHTRRNRLPTSHAYQRRGGGRSNPLRRGERSHYLRQLAIAYGEVVRIGVQLGL